MARTSVSDVKDIIELDTLSDSQITAFMNDASQIVDNRLKGQTTDANLKLIEKWLTAHLCAIREKRVRRSAVGDTDFSYEGNSTDGMGLEFTRYGQQAVALDPTGRLKAMPHYVTAVNEDEDTEDAYDVDWGE